MVNTLLKKLQIKNGFKVKVVNAPPHFLTIIGDDATVEFTFDDATLCNALLIFATKQVEIDQAVQQNIEPIRKNKITWILYPKTKTKLAKDLNLMQSSNVLRNYGLTPCASASLNEAWTALRIKPEAATKRTGQSNAQILQNDYGNYINVIDKIVTLPKDLKVQLEKQELASSFFNQLSYSNKKEYVIWVLTAKQEKTRLERIQKTIQKLIAGKKNPGEK